MKFYQQAKKKLEQDFGKITDIKAAAMKTAVRDALLNFAEQDEEFAQAIVQGGTFSACMAEVARGVGRSISDLEAYGKAAAFYFPGSKVRFEMHIDLIGDAAGDERAADTLKGTGGVGPYKGGEKDGGLVIDLSAFL